MKTNKRYLSVLIENIPVILSVVFNLHDSYTRKNPNEDIFWDENYSKH